MRKIKIAQIGALHDHSEPVIRALKKFPEIFDIVG